LVSGIRDGGSVRKEKLIGVLDGDYFLIHGFHFVRDISGVTELRKKGGF
jgi:hypothetical protein